jgi:diphthamide biosynthesis protein 4
MTTQPIATHYDILDLPSNLRNESKISVQTLRAAYRRALLRHHPDKSSSKPTLNPLPEREALYTVDEITNAFRTLSDPQTRAAYNISLALKHSTIVDVVGGGNSKEGWKTGIETADLDDLERSDDEAGGQTWYRGCRCGEERGFVVTEEDLEYAGREGEVTVGCRGCSLWLRVLFGVIEDDGI